MDYYTRTQKVIDFIENNLNDPLSLPALSRIAGFSLYHFHRVFQAMLGCTLKEYIRKRRLTNSAYQLIFSEKTVLEIALDAQYNTHESFSRAFKKEFKINPNEFRQNNKLANLFGKINLLKNRTQTQGETSMQPDITTIPGFNVIGVKLKTSIVDEQNLNQIPEFWQKYFEFRRAEKIPNRTNPDNCYGICMNYNNNGDFSYIIGEEVTSLDRVPDGYTGLTIPAAQYAVFHVKGSMPESIQAATKSIYGEWFPRSGREHAYTPEFERYDSRMLQEQPEMDICIPVK